MKKRILAAILAAAMMVTAFAGCAGGKMMTIDGKSISSEAYAEQFLSAKTYYEQYMGQINWKEDTETLESVKAQIETVLKRELAFEKLYREYDIKLTSEDKKEVESWMEQTIAQYDDEQAFEEQLKQVGFTRKEYEQVILESRKQYKLVENLAHNEDGSELTDEQALAYLNESTPRVKHILITEDKALAQAVLDKAKAGEDFDALIAQYGEDPGMESSPEGYYLSKGQMVKEFEDASYALEIDQISDLVESQYGYHIIKRYPLEEAYIENNLALTKSNMGTLKLQEKISALLDGMEVVYADDFDKQLDALIDANPYVAPESSSQDSASSETTVSE